MVKKMLNNTQAPVILKSISLSSFFSTVLRYWKILLSVFCACFISLSFYYLYLTTPMYTSTAKLYITNKSSDLNQITSTDFNISTYLTRDFAEILTDEVILSEVAEELSNEYSTSQIKKFINITPAENTRIIEVVVISPDAKASKQIADSICRISQDKLVEIMGLDRVKIIRNGNLPKAPSSPNLVSDIGNAFLFSLLIALATAFIILISDNKLSSCDDVTEFLDINILTTIPYTNHKSHK